MRLLAGELPLQLLRLLLLVGLWNDHLKDEASLVDSIIYGLVKLFLHLFINALLEFFFLGGCEDHSDLLALILLVVLFLLFL